METWRQRREGEAGPANIANYNIISSDSNIDEPLGSNGASNEELRNYLGAIDCTSAACLFSRVHSSMWPSNKRSALAAVASEEKWGDEARSYLYKEKYKIK